MDIYKFAAQNGLRFPSVRGALTVEQLFDLPLKHVAGFDLDTVAKGINANLKSVSEESFVEESTNDPQKQRWAIALEIVKDVIATRQLQLKAVRQKAERNAERTKILDAIAAQNDKALSQASIEELKKKLADLDRD